LGRAIEHQTFAAEMRSNSIEREAFAPSLTGMAVDLHTHSTSSDGTESPTAVIEGAAAAGLSSIALTDHDTLEGIPEAQTAADRLGIELIPGAEISCEWAPGTMHMVILFLEPGPGPLQDRLRSLQDARSRRNEVIVERLNDLGMGITYEEILDEAGSGSVGRPHFAAVMERKGYVESFRAAFDEYLANGRPAYVARERLEPETAIRLSRQSGAVPVIAHPHTLGLNTAEEFASFYEHMAGLGLAGIEAYYGEYLLVHQHALAATLRSHGLIPSGGSDYHGSYKAGLEIGTGRGWLHVADAVLDELRAAR
jgi:predicted metal-dependent phosphoesterase TrpH